MDTLISIGQILDKTIDHYVKHFKVIIRISLWLLITSVLLIIAGFLLPAQPDPSMFLSSLLPIHIVGYALLIITTAIIAPVVSIWILLNIIIVTDQLVQNKPVDLKASGKTAWKMFFPFAWVSFLRLLVSLIAFGAVVPGIVLIIANIYFDGGVWLGAISILITFLGSIAGIILLLIISTMLSFVGYILLLENKRGTSALRTSKELVKGRFWNVLVRLLVPRIIFTSAIIIVQFFLILISTPLFGLAATDISVVSHIADIFNNASGGLISALSIPLLVIADYYLYDSLRKTRKS